MALTYRTSIKVVEWDDNVGDSAASSKRVAEVFRTPIEDPENFILVATVDQDDKSESDSDLLDRAAEVIDSLVNLEGAAFTRDYDETGTIIP